MTDPPRKPEPDAAVRGERARHELLFEFESGASETRAAFREIAELLDGTGRGVALGPVSEAWKVEEVAGTRALFTAALRTRRLALELEPRTSLDVIVPDEVAPPPLPPAPPTPTEESFIAVHLLDQNGDPVVGRKYVIELPDGSAREGVTDADGWARETGFTQNGSAKIVFPEFDELDFKTKTASERRIVPIEGDDAAAPAAAEPEPDAETASEDASEVDEPNAEEPTLGGGAHFFEFTVADEDDVPVANARYKISTADGKTFEGTTDAKGSARIVGIDAAEATLTLLDRDGSEWSVD